MALPFTTQVPGVEVIVERLDLTTDEHIVAVCRHGRTRQRIPILDLPLPKRMAGRMGKRRIPGAGGADPERRHGPEPRWLV